MQPPNETISLPGFVGDATSTRPRLVQYFTAWMARCVRRSRERAELRNLDPRLRQDIGFSRVLEEDGKPFWRE